LSAVAESDFLTFNVLLYPFYPRSANRRLHIFFSALVTLIFASGLVGAFVYFNSQTESIVDISPTDSPTCDPLTASLKDYSWAGLTTVSASVPRREAGAQDFATGLNTINFPYDSRSIRIEDGLKRSFLTKSFVTDGSGLNQVIDLVLNNPTELNRDSPVIINMTKFCERSSGSRAVLVVGLSYTSSREGIPSPASPWLTLQYEERSIDTAPFANSRYDLLHSATWSACKLQRVSE